MSHPIRSISNYFYQQCQTLRTVYSKLLPLPVKYLGRPPLLPQLPLRRLHQERRRDHRFGADGRAQISHLVVPRLWRLRVADCLQPHAARVHAAGGHEQQQGALHRGALT